MKWGECVLHNKAEYINNLFSRIAAKYDFLNDLMTFALHRRWKRKLIAHASVNLRAGSRILDLCTGTGDIAETWLQETRAQEIIALDACRPMLAAGYDRILKKFNNSFPSRLKMLEGDALNLPFPDQHFDAITIGFGLRNVSDLPKAMLEIKRVLKPNGIVASLDLGHPPVALISFFYKKIFLFFIPMLGMIFANDRAAYKYLIDSLETWPSQKKLSEAFYELGFQRAYYEDLLLGAVAIVAAER